MVCLLIQVEWHVYNGLWTNFIVYELIILITIVPVKPHAVVSKRQPKSISVRHKKYSCISENYATTDFKYSLMSIKKFYPAAHGYWQIQDFWSQMNEFEWLWMNIFDKKVL